VVKKMGGGNVDFKIPSSDELKQLTDEPLLYALTMKSEKILLIFSKQL
jgi:hypothetical protein